MTMTVECTDATVAANARSPSPPSPIACAEPITLKELDTDGDGSLNYAEAGNGRTLIDDLIAALPAALRCVVPSKVRPSLPPPLAFPSRARERPAASPPLRARPRPLRLACVRVRPPPTTSPARRRARAGCMPAKINVSRTATSSASSSPARWARSPSRASTRCAWRSRRASLPVRLRLPARPA